MQDPHGQLGVLGLNDAGDNNIRGADLMQCISVGRESQGGFYGLVFKITKKHKIWRQEKNGTGRDKGRRKLERIIASVKKGFVGR